MDSEGEIRVLARLGRKTGALGAHETQIIRQAFLLESLWWWSRPGLSAGGLYATPACRGLYRDGIIANLDARSGTLADRLIESSLAVVITGV